MGKSSAPAAPNYSGLIQAATDQSNRYQKLMEEELQFSKDAYHHQLPYTDEIQKLNLQTSKDAADFAKSQRAQYQNLYQPLAEQFVGEAKDYTSEDKMARARGQAMGAVGQTFDAAGDAAKRSLESYGIDPSATRFAALDVGTRTAKAAATAAAGTKSDVDREAARFGLESAALNIGNGLPGQVAGLQNSGTAAGASGVNSGNSTYSAYSGALGNPLGFGSLSSNALGQAGSFTNMGYQNALSGYSANQNSSSGLGAALGLAGGIAGGVFGGPMGFMAGSSLGGAAGRAFAEGGAVPVAGQAVPTALSPSAGAQTDDVPATVNGSAIPMAAINADEFIFPKDVAKWLGEEKLQKMIVKAREDKAKAGARPEQGTEQSGPAQSDAPPQQALQIGGPHMASGGAVPAVTRITRAWPGAGGGTGRMGALPVGRPHMPTPYPGGSPAGAVRSAIPGV